jgi:hypothetical protein
MREWWSEHTDEMIDPFLLHIATRRADHTSGQKLVRFCMCALFKTFALYERLADILPLEPCSGTMGDIGLHLRFQR